MVEFLNEICRIDPYAMYELIESRVPCNQELSDHPTVQVQLDRDGGPVVGFLGVLNGWYGLGGERLVANVDIENRMVESFVVVPA